MPVVAQLADRPAPRIRKAKRDDICYCIDFYFKDARATHLLASVSPAPPLGECSAVPPLWPDGMAGRCAWLTLVHPTVSFAWVGGWAGMKGAQCLELHAGGTVLDCQRGHCWSTLLAPIAGVELTIFDMMLTGVV